MHTPKEELEKLLGCAPTLLISPSALPDLSSFLPGTFLRLAVLAKRGHSPKQLRLERADSSFIILCKGPGEKLGVTHSPGSHLSPPCRWPRGNTERATGKGRVFLARAGNSYPHCPPRPWLLSLPPSTPLLTVWKCENPKSQGTAIRPLPRENSATPCHKYPTPRRLTSERGGRRELGGPGGVAAVVSLEHGGRQSAVRGPAASHSRCCSGGFGLRGAADAPWGPRSKCRYPAPLSARGQGGSY